MALNLFHRTVHFLARPFVEAESLGEYSSKGYWIFGGFCSAAIIVFLIVGGYISGLASQTPSGAQRFVSFLLKLVRLDGLPDSIPLSVVILILYIGLGIPARTRNYVGEKLANAFYHFMNFIITLGEWCIENRGLSTVLVIVLVSVFIWGGTRIVEKNRRESILNTSYKVWLQDAERFVVRESFYTVRKEKINDVNDHWQDDFEEILKVRGGGTHPAILLHKATLLMSSTLRGQSSKLVESSNQLINTANDFAKIAEECNQKCGPVEKMDEQARKSRDLLFILVGRIYNLKPSDMLMVEQSNKYFTSVQDSYYKDREEDRPYLFSVNRGRGTVFAALFSLLSTGKIKETKLCTDTAQCALEAFDAYDASARNFVPCSYAWRARANNITDLLARLGLVYEDIVNKNHKLDERAQMTTDKDKPDKDKLVANIEKNIGDMLSCNSEAGENPDFVTIAQAYSAAAGLKEANSADKQRLLQSAGTYLRLAQSYEPSSNMSTWEFQFFCPTLSGGQLVTSFRDNLCSPTLDALSKFYLKEFKRLLKATCHYQEPDIGATKSSDEEPCGSRK